MPLLGATPSMLKNGPFHIVNRMVTQATSVMINFMFYTVIYNKNIRFATDPQKVHDAFDRIMEDLAVGDGFPGMKERKQEPSNLDTVIPPMRSSSQYYTKTDNVLPSEYDEFLAKQKGGAILVAFGTTWQPTESMVKGIIAAAKERSDIGFVFSLKETWETHKIVKEANLPNTLLRTFVPQLELLNDDRIRSFISHGGGNSILESMYYGVPLIGAPIDADQFAAAFRVEQLGIGISLGKECTKENVLNVIDKIQAPGSKW